MFEKISLIEATDHKISTGKYGTVMRRNRSATCLFIVSIEFGCAVS